MTGVECIQEQVEYLTNRIRGLDDRIEIMVNDIKNCIQLKKDLTEQVNGLNEDISKLN